MDRRSMAVRHFFDSTNKRRAVSCFLALLWTLATAWAGTPKNGKPNSENSAKVLGILIQFDQDDPRDNPALKKLLNKHSLQVGPFYRRLKVLSLKNTLAKPHRPAQHWDAVCRDFKALPEVIHCEPESVLKADSPNPQLGQRASSESDPAICIPSIQANPELYRQVEETLRTITPPCRMISDRLDNLNVLRLYETTGLSTHWAQRYTGSDIRRSEIESENDPPPPGSFYVLDSFKEKHAELVLGLIAGPHSSALLPGQKTHEYFNLESTENYLEAYENVLDLQKQKNVCPKVFNNSMSWRNSALVRQAVEGLVDHCSAIFVTSAGNEGKNIVENENEKALLAIANKLIVVGSLSPQGWPSHFTSYGDEVSISAPSDDYILSTDAKGHPTLFSGTSGAAPQVTAALTDFMQVTRSHLNTRDALRLLRKTALPIIGLPSPSQLGAGMLNSYKIGAVAKKIQSSCAQTPEGPKRNTCVSQALQGDSSFDFSLKDQEWLRLQTQFGAHFPECGGLPIPFAKTLFDQEAKEDNLCETKQSVFTAIRKVAFLSSEKIPQIWNQIACVFENEGYNTESLYYRNLAKRLEHQQHQSESSVPHFMYTQALDSSHPLTRRSAIHALRVASPKDTESLNKLLNTAFSDDYILRYYAIDTLISLRPVNPAVYQGALSVLLDHSRDHTTRLDALRIFAALSPQTSETRETLAKVAESDPHLLVRARTTNLLKESAQDNR